MSINVRNQTFYEGGCLDSDLKTWQNRLNAEDVGNGVQIQPGGYCGTELKATYNSALNSSSYRLIRMKFAQIDMDESNNYANLAYILLKVSYNNGENKQLIIVNATLEGSAYNSTTKELTVSRIVEMLNYPLDSCEIIAYNKSQAAFILSNVEVYRSQDIAPSQVSASITNGITVKGFTVKSDGFKVDYEDTTESDYFWWIERQEGDTQVPAGININNNKLVSIDWDITNPLIDPAGEGSKL